MARKKWGSLGLPAPNTDLKILGSNEQELAVGESGEIAIQTPSATVGYWQNPKATDELFRGNWILSGDLGYKDEEGYVWFVSRKKLLIVRRGSNISPIEIENVIDNCPGVHASVVVGVKDKRDGQVPVACVARLTSSDRPSAAELSEFVARHLATYKNPVQYLFFDQLPKNHTGKFDRNQLQQLATELIHQPHQTPS